MQCLEDNKSQALASSCIQSGAIDYIPIHLPHDEFRARIESGLRRSSQSRNLIYRDLVRSKELQKRLVQLEETSLKLEEQYRELDMLDRIVSSVNKETDLKKVLERLLRDGLQLLPCAKNGVFLLYDKTLNLYQFEMVIGYELEKARAIRILPVELEARLTSKQDQLVEGIYHGRGYRGEMPTKAEIPIPMATLAMEIKHGQHLRGFLIWDHPTDEHAFDHSDVRKLSRFRQHANSAVARAWFFKEMVDRNEQLKSGFQYARRIQSAISPPSETLSEAFPEYFLISKPKHMVSSDFYWYGETEEARWLVVGDCKGHAVAGALMSILATQLLDAIILKNKVTKPAAILEAMHLGLIDILKLKDNEEDSIKIDIGIVRIGHHRNRVTFAGAKRPLYWMKSRKQGPRSTSIKGDRQPVGGRHAPPPFSTHLLEVEKGDMLYLTTDGYALQLCEGHKKFGIIKLNSLLQEIMSYDMAAQETRLLQALDAHRGEEEQTDDVTIIGLRF